MLVGSAQLLLPLGVGFNFYKAIQSSSPQPFGHQGLLSWKTTFPQTRAGGGFKMIQAHYIYCIIIWCAHIIKGS